MKRWGILAAVIMALSIVAGAWAISSITFNVAVNVRAPEVTALSPTSIVVDLEPGDSSTFTIRLFNASLARSVQFFANNVPPFLTVGCPATGCVQSLVPGESVFTFTVTALPTAPLGPAGFLIVVDDPAQ